MPRPTTTREEQPFPIPDQEGAVPEIATFWDQPQGTDLVSPINRLGVNKTPRSNNLTLSTAGRYGTRFGTAILGAAAASPIVGLITASNLAGFDFHVRVTTTGVEVNIGGGWIAYTGPALAIPPYTYIEFSAWGGKLMFTDNISGLYEIDFDASTYALIAEAPIGRHLTTFGGRAILSNIATLPTRVQWSVKNNNADWSGLGSGFDDMLSAPGGLVDIQHGIFPLTDTEALIVRSGSIWSMSLTGFSDTPFLFNFRFAQGTDSPQSIVRLPTQELIMLGRNDVILVSPGGIRDLGLPVRDQLIGSAFVARNARAAFDRHRMKYLLYVPPATPTPTESIVWEYDVLGNTWHKLTYPFQIKVIAPGDAQRALSIGELLGEIGDLEGPIGELGLLGRTQGMTYAHAGDRVVSDSESAVVDSTSAGGTQPVPIELLSGLVQFGGPLAGASLIHLQLEYTSTRAIDAVLEVSTDAGLTWEAYGTLTLPISLVPKVAVFRKTVERKQFQFRLTAVDAVGLELIAAYAYGQRGAPINL